MDILTSSQGASTEYYDIHSAIWTKCHNIFQAELVVNQCSRFVFSDISNVYIIVSGAHADIANAYV